MSAGARTFRRFAGRPFSTLGAAAGATVLSAAHNHAQRLTEAGVDPLEKYKLGDKLGQGAFAVVRLATSKLTGEKFALKLVDKKFTKPAAMEQELSVLRAVGRHRHLVGLVEDFELPAEYGLVLELATGGEVFDRICERGTYSERDAAAVVRQVAGALAHVHAAQVVHRDIKPENLLHVDASDEAPVKVCDFGLSVFYGGRHPPPKGAAGTVAYMAPEMLSKRDYGPAVDLWAVGVVLYILLGGYHPFDPSGEADDRKMIQQIKACRWDFDDDDWTQVSAQAKAVITGLLAAKPEQRPTAAQLLAMPWVSDGTTASDASLGTEKLRSFNEARRTWRAAAAAAAMVARAAPGISPQAAVADAPTGDAGAVLDGLNAETVEEMRVAFRAFDRDGSGEIDSQELALSMSRMGMSGADAQAAMRRVDANADGSISFAEFCQAMAPIYAQGSKSKALRRAFDFFDVDGSGYIDRKELASMLSKLGLMPSSDVALEAIFRAADTNGDNQISFDEFISILSSDSDKLERQVRGDSGVKR